MEGETYRRAEKTGKDFDALRRDAERLPRRPSPRGPLRSRRTAPDRRRVFDAERPGPGPIRWPPTRRTEAPEDPQERAARVRSRPASRRRPASSTSRASSRSIATAISSWACRAPRCSSTTRRCSPAICATGACGSASACAIHVAPGRHRVVARVLDDRSSMRILETDGRPAPLQGRHGSRRAVRDRSRRASSTIRTRSTRSCAAEGTRRRSTRTSRRTSRTSRACPTWAASSSRRSSKRKTPRPIMLESAATYAHDDPIYPQEVKHRPERELFHGARRQARPKLWYARAWLVLDDAEQTGFVEAVDPLRKLADDFSTQPELLEQLARIYGRLGWRAERMQTLADLASRFPDDVRALRAYERRGLRTARSRTPTRSPRACSSSSPTTRSSSTSPSRATTGRPPSPSSSACRSAAPSARRWPAASPTSSSARAIRARPLEQLAQGAREEPARRDLALPPGRSRLRAGRRDALRKALADALLVGASGEELRAAIDLLEGTTDLEPFRLDGRAVDPRVRGLGEDGQEDGRRQRARPRLLGALGAPRRLERDARARDPEDPSQGAINQEAEQKPPSGLVLRLRVIKANGRILEPEPVAGKPTLTMPNLEVGDYVEIEHVTKTEGDGDRGRRYRGPTWFFREKDKGYWRSEFVVLTPKDKPLEIETRGNVGEPSRPSAAPTSSAAGASTRARRSPKEPDAPSRPSTSRACASAGASRSTTPSPASSISSATRRRSIRACRREALHRRAGRPGDRSRGARAPLYRAVLERVQDGQEKDGRRACSASPARARAPSATWCARSA